MVDLNLLYARLDDYSNGVGQNQLGCVVTASKAISDPRRIADEFAGLHPERVKPFSQFLISANYGWILRLAKG